MIFHVCSVLGRGHSSCGTTLLLDKPLDMFMANPDPQLYVCSSYIYQSQDSGNQSFQRSASKSGVSHEMKSGLFDSMLLSNNSKAG